MVIAAVIYTPSTATANSTMDIFFHFPAEIQTHILRLLSPRELDHLFQLRQLVSHPLAKYDPYLIVRHNALSAMYHRKLLVISNDAQLGKFTLSEIEYLVHHNIVISPRSITFALFDFTNYQCSLTYISAIFETYLPHLQRFTTNFNIRLILVEDVPLDNSLLKALFQPLRSSALNVNWFTIKYLAAYGTIHSRRNDMEFDMQQIYQNTEEIAVENLLLHLFNPDYLLKHLVDSTGCFYCENLRTLDLSYNNLTDWSLRHIKFPQSLEYVNLSNNLLQELSRITFPFRTLLRLEELDLSNNNLMRIEFRSHREDVQYQLKSVNLSGNLLTTYSELFECPLFAQVESIDLSRNLLNTVSKFPTSTRSIDLSGNYFALRSDLIKDIFPQHLERLCISSGNFTGGCCEEFARTLVRDAQLRYLTELNICGSREVPIPVC